MVNKNLKLLVFGGIANGTTLTRLYNINDLLNNYIKIISINFAYYTNGGGLPLPIESYYDNLTQTVNVNTRYRCLTQYSSVRILPYNLEKISGVLTPSLLRILINGNDINLMSYINIGTVQLPAFENLNLNLLIKDRIVSGLDLILSTTFILNPETPTNFNPNVKVSVLVEILDNIKCL